MSSRRVAQRYRVADQVHSAAIHLLRRLRKSDAEVGLSATRLSALSVLVFGGDRTLGELARAEQVTPPTMSKLVQALEVEGFVRREVAATDKRAIRLTATKKGRRVLKQGRRLRVEGLAELMKLLKAEEVDALARAAALLEKLAAE